jgi:acetate CoA/acetoacetate CoA-transferase alpha subunit
MENIYGKITTLQSALELFGNDMTIMFGGFGGVGSPPTIIEGIVNKGLKNLTLIGNDTGFPEIGIGKMVSRGMAKKVIVSHIGSNPLAGKYMTEGKLEVEFCPQGILAERIRAGGIGLGGVLSDIGFDIDVVAKDKPCVQFNGKNFLIESALTGDVSIIYAQKADPFGNLVYDKSARNTNPLVAMAGDLTIVEVEEIVPLGSLSPEEIVTPGIFVDRIIQSQGVNWKWAWE